MCPRLARTLRRFHRDNTAVTAIEYALLAMFVAMAITGGAILVGNGVSSSLGSASAAFTPAQQTSTTTTTTPGGSTTTNSHSDGDSGH